MSPTVEADAVERLSPADAFLLLGHEVRLDILRALWEAPGQSATFSELQAAVDEPDNGRLNYHRSELTGHFVARTDDGDGFRLRETGKRVVRAVLAGSFTVRAEREPTAVDGECPDCSATLSFRYADDVATVRCGDCDRTWQEYEFPPGGLAARGTAALARAVDATARHELALARDGVCPKCAGPVDAALVRGSADYFGHPVHVRRECDRCGFHPRQTLGAAALDHPAVVSFFRDRGVDVPRRRTWELGFALDSAAVDLAGEDPLRGRLSIERDGDELALFVGPDGEVDRVDPPG